MTSHLNLVSNNQALRISHVRLAEKLGYKDPTSLLQLIQRHRERLQIWGDIATGSDASGEDTFYLSGKQAAVITIFSRAKNARRVHNTLFKFDTISDCLASGIMPPQCCLDALNDVDDFDEQWLKLFFSARHLAALAS